MMTLLRDHDLARAFDHASRTYDRLTALNPGYRSELLRSARRLRLPDDGAGLRVADLGCGTGASTRALLRAAPRAHITAVDASSGMLHRALEQFLTDVYFGDLDALFLDLPPGTARFKLGGSSTHNGLRDITSTMGGPAFWRLRIGIGHPRDLSPGKPVVDFVLDRPSREHARLIDEAIDRAVEVLPLVAADDWPEAMKLLHTQA